MIYTIVNKIILKIDLIGKANKLGAEILVHEEGYEDIPIENIISAHDEKYNHKKFTCSDSNMSEMRKVTMDIGGKEYSDKIMKSIEE